MKEKYTKTLRDKLDADSMAKLEALDNDALHAFVADAVELCQPDRLVVCSDSPQDTAYIRNRTIEACEERKLNIEGHTVHFDGYNDQARDKEATKYLVPAEMQLDKSLNQTGRAEGLTEIRGFLAGSMKGRTVYLRLFCLGPTNSPFSISCVQITDSAYVAHSEDLLYRGGYEQFKRLGNSGDFFRVLHSAGRLDERNCSADIDKRRIYIDISADTVYSVNTQYAGNTVGFKKLSLRLAIRKADRDGWLAEHMFIMGSHGPGGRVTYFCGAFPSACGKTSTAMIPGETIVGDDLAYFRVIDGEMRAANVESGIFGIIRDVNSKDDPVIYEALTTPGEVIFSNVLVTDGTPSWLGMGKELPTKGENHGGEWHKGKTDAKGNEIDPSHKNARYTVALAPLANLDPKADDPQGVPIGGIIYGGRDSDTSVPVQQSFDWAHGIVAMAASLESETTAATLGAEGVRKFNIMSNMDFLAIPLGKYIQNNLDFASAAEKAPPIFSTNYFLKNAEGEYLNGMLDKAVWIKWMELRVHGDCDAIVAPTGQLPKYEDLKGLFNEVLDRDYTEQEYVEQFTIRVKQLLAKIDRIEKIYRESIADAPAIVLEALDAQRKRLLELQAAKGVCVSPLDL